MIKTFIVTYSVPGQDRHPKGSTVDVRAISAEAACSAARVIYPGAQVEGAELKPGQD